jgi:cyclic-di-GMP-binding biofilm dispersal mediator protein
MARELDRRGARSTLVARDARRLEDLAVPGTRYACDLRSPHTCERAAAAAVRLDVLVNCVGVVAFGAVTELSYETFEEPFRADVFVATLVARAALPVLQRGGAIATSSGGVIAERDLPGMAADGASKAAVRSFDEALVREARRSGIRVLDPRPRHADTGLAGRAIEGPAPKMPAGLSAASVASAICDALEPDAVDLPSGEFSANRQ